MKKAFSLIEVIFVLVILGIVASISSQIIVQVYENYITQRAIYNTSTKTELVATQIVNRLTFAIDGSTIAKDLTSANPTVEDDGWIKLKDIPSADTNFTTIEWIGYDNDSFAASETPYWSSVIDYETATRNTFITPGSALNQVAIIMRNLSDGEVDLTESNPAALVFIQKDGKYRTGKEYSPQCMGLIDNNTSCIFPVKIGATNDQLTVRSSRLNEPKIVTERYKLAWSAYALVPEDPDGDSLFDLYLYHNYQPWNNERYTSGTKSLLIKNISVFKFTENGGVIQFKICATENIGQAFNISSCKEKAIIR